MDNLDALSTWELEPPAPLSVSSASVAPWPPRLAFDVAMGEGQEKLLQLYALTADQLDNLFHYQPFRREVANHQRELRDNGVTFKAKARLQAEEYLLELHGIVHSPDTPPSVRLDAIKSVVKWGGLEPAPQPSASQNQQTNQTTRFEIAWLPSQPQEGTSQPHLAIRATTTTTQSENLTVMP